MKATEFRDLQLNNLVQFLSERSPTKERKALQKASTVAAYIAQSMLNRKGYECEYISVVHAAMCCYPLSERDTTEKMHAIYTTFAVILTEYLTVAPKR